MSVDEVSRIADLFLAAGLPVQSPQEMSAEKFLSLMSVDKKVQDGVIRLVLLKGIGEAIISDDYDVEKLQETLVAFQEKQ
jgi:3-dehydroquinate synthase